MKFPLIPNLRERLITARAVLLYLLFWLVLVLASFFVHRADQQRDQERAFLDPPYISANTTSPTSLLVVFLVKTIDPITASAKLGMSLLPSEDLIRSFEAGGRIVGSSGSVGQDIKDIIIDDPTELAAMAGLNRPVLARGMAVMARGFRKNFPVGSRLPNEDTFTVPFTKSSVRGYPYDSHSGDLDVSAFLFPDPASGVNTSTPLQIQVLVDNAARGFKFTPGFPSTPAGKAKGPFFVEVTFRLQRNLITIGFSIFIIAMLWILSIVIGFLALQVTTKERPAVAAMLGPPISLLFALPSLRNVQPQAPPVGSTSDVIGFFWNMVIVALSAVAIIYAFIDGWTPPPPPPKDTEPLVKAS